MKRVRFETLKSAESFIMNDSECHSPRPFIEGPERTNAVGPSYDSLRVLTYSSDPVKRYDYSDSSPYPSVNKIRTSLPEQKPSWNPSDDLELSLLDASSCEPRQPTFSKSALKTNYENRNGINGLELRKPQVLASIENNPPPNVLVKDNSFFIRRDNLDKYHLSVNPLHNQFKTLNIGKENNPYATKAGMMNKVLGPPVPASPCQIEPKIKPIIKTSCHEPPKYTKPKEDHCPCHHCIKILENIPSNPLVEDHHVHNTPHDKNYIPSGFNQSQMTNVQSPGHIHCPCTQPRACTQCCQTQIIQRNQSCSCCNSPQNAVDKKTWAIKKFEQEKQSDCMEVEKQTNVSKEKREPTVADLFKIIKLQNEQLQLLQEKVDKFISSQQNMPTISCSTEQVSISGNDQMKMSIGVMTSFEMVRTSTVINKEVLKQTNENQIQCNRSQISIKEVVTKPANQNFLDGIMPVNNSPECKQVENGADKTLNELSLYNVQVDNATTPNISPEQTLYLDVRDYSESDTSSNDQSNVGCWTYYNKVMTHVNGMLQDSEMPSSASAMFRNTRQQCVQMHIDKSNVSVTKRVKFGDDPLGIHQPHLYATDTSLKMNQLAAKYLNAQAPPPPKAPQKSANIDMSFATRNYMERHKLLQGIPPESAQKDEIPRFLDITALKQQPKFL